MKKSTPPALDAAHRDMAATTARNTASGQSSFAVGSGSASAVREIDSFMEGLMRRNAGEPEFHQAV
ncbi:MAG: hypothetical protein AAFQ96_04885, partial [Pseudomonadota bacterium]